ncbi:helix-turn-helix domain-containing protein [Epilithonimonas ginsengisoli]|uniref:Helix-turn-helix domain-containing protein n=1 Tax=Epilithonimonas ginsengisoli TaxID=1245592 RepID=A0ABU4JDF3_9FLAO|nr:MULTISPECIES: helix-turn-helix domain-containing protein [Chryseobacterium group]MBV6878675.1 helix-turn-helix domain-containing protein [Epilithonimonas sp. FP105]MDW8547700.1 helix-turn-helix domain-containing protein [Epilithonimonas ginsengisoli]OAH75924.1 XRE family transcriptional regulator [Chryseobacterium sp. FP211-J200]
MANLKTLREAKNLTQTELAEKSGLSLRTIQRIESGNIPKGFTLKAIAKALDLDPEDLFSSTEESIDLNRAKLINLSALSGLIIPFGGIIFPAILTYKTKDPVNRELGKNIISLQIVLAAVVSILMIISPFIQKAISIKFPLFLIPLILFIVVKMFIIFKNGISLNKRHELSIKLKTNFL